LLFLDKTAAAHKNIMDFDAIKTIFFWLRIEYNHFSAKPGAAQPICQEFFPYQEKEAIYGQPRIL
jgi:hypothetical protein